MKAYNLLGDPSLNIHGNGWNVSGPSVINPSGVYTLSNNIQATLWIVEPSNAFTISSSNSSSATITATPTAIANGQTGRIIAIVNGARVIKSIQACKPVISGSSLLCSGSQATFTVNNPPDFTYSWTHSSNLTPGTTTDNTKKFTGNINGAAAWVAINVGTVELARHTFWVGKPSVNLTYDLVERGQPIPLGVIVSPNEVFIGDIFAFYSNAQPNTSTVTWTTTPAASTALCWMSSKTAKCYTIPYCGEFTVNATASNTCGSTAGLVYLHVLPGPLIPIKSIGTPYPNPATDILNIELNQETITQNQSQNYDLEQNTINDKSNIIDATYDLRLYDNLGNLLRQAVAKDGTVQFNVSNLPAGIYYLHIYDGVSEKPEIHQIMVER